MRNEQGGWIVSCRRLFLQVSKLPLATICLVVAMPFVASTASAAEYYWSVTSGDWSVALNWGDKEPTLGGTAYINNGGTVSIASAWEASSYLYLGSDTGFSGNIRMTAGSLAIGNDEYIGYIGNGSFTQSGGTHTVANNLNLGYYSNATGSYTVSDSSNLSADYEYIGYFGKGSIVQSGGTNAVSNSLYLGKNSLSSGCYELSNGQLSVGGTSLGEIVGYYGNGSFTQSGGTNSITNSLFLGFYAGATGYYTLSGGLLSGSTASDGYVGFSGSGVFTQTGGTYSARMLNLGTFSGASGSYSLSGATSLLTCSSVDIDNGSFLQNGGTHSLSGDLALGRGTTLHGDYTLSDTGVLSVRCEYVGSGTFTQTGGTHTVASAFGIGYISGITGTYSLSGGLLSNTSTSSYGEYVGYNGNGLFLQSGGTSSIASNLYIGYNSSDTGTYQLSGGQLSVNSSSYGEYVGYNGYGSFTQTGGTNQISNRLYLAYNTGSTGVYNFEGGKLILKSLWKGSGTAQFNFGGGTLQAGGTIASSLPMTLTGIGGNATIDTASYVMTLTGAIVGVGGLNKIGLGILTLSGTNSYSGCTQVSNGTIVIGGSAALGTGGLVVSDSGSVQFGSYNFVSNGSSSRLSGGNITAHSHFVGSSGTGAFTQSGGTNTVSTGLYLGQYSGDSGTYQLSGGKLSATSASYGEYIGLSGKGAFTQNGGTNAIAYSLNLGFYSGSSGSYDLRDTGLLSTARDYIGYYGTGSFVQSGGTHTIDGALNLGSFGGSTGTYHLEGGKLILKSLIQGKGTAQFNFGGGTLQAGGTLSTSVPTTLTGIGGNAKVDTAGYAVTLSSVLSGVGGLQKLGGGTLTLASQNSYSGDTVVQAGTLNITGGIGNEGTALLDIQAGNALFQTTNIVKSDFTVRTAKGAAFEIVGGTHQIGNLTGVGNVTVDSGSKLIVLDAVNMTGGKITVQNGAGISFGTPYANDHLYTVSGMHVQTIDDDLGGSGGLEKRGAGTLILAGKNTYLGKTTVSAGILEFFGDVDVGDKISVADGAGIVFGTPCSPSTAPESILGGSFGSTTQSLCDPTGTAGQAGSGTQMLTSDIAAVPEPGTMILLAASFLGVAVAVRRKRV